MHEHVRIEKLELSKTWDVSTMHISRADADLLGILAEEGQFVVHRYLEGFWLIVPDDDAWEELIQEEEGQSYFMSVGLTAAVSNILAIARAHKIRYVRLDADAPTYDFLDEYHW